MYEWMKKGKYRVVGPGNNYIPRIHVEDCAEAYIRILEKMPIGESFIIADDEPCTVREFVDLMANCMDVQKPKSIPRLLARIFLGKTLYDTVMMNCRVSNVKAKNQLNWEPKFPTYRDGLPPTIKELNMKRK